MDLHFGQRTFFPAIFAVSRNWAPHEQGTTAAVEGVADGVLELAGTMNGWPHAEHFTRFPANSSFTRKVLPHEQLALIVIERSHPNTARPWQMQSDLRCHRSRGARQLAQTQLPHHAQRTTRVNRGTAGCKSGSWLRAMLARRATKTMDHRRWRLLGTRMPGKYGSLDNLMV